MEWWQIASILVSSLGAGAAVGALLSYLILQFSKRRKTKQMVEQILNEARYRVETELEKSGQTSR